MERTLMPLTYDAFVAFNVSKYVFLFDVHVCEVDLHLVPHLIIGVTLEVEPAICERWDDKVHISARRSRSHRLYHLHELRNNRLGKTTASVQASSIINRIKKHLINWGLLITKCLIGYIYFALMRQKMFLIDVWTNEWASLFIIFNENMNSNHPYNYNYKLSQTQPIIVLQQRLVEMNIVLTNQINFRYFCRFERSTCHIVLFKNRLMWSWFTQRWWFIYKSGNVNKLF